MPSTPFIAASAPLQQSNLIEASAGTGKTYSIALLSLRLILQEKIPIQEILMVTFTKAAVAELEIRVRSFVRMAQQASKGLPIKDPAIVSIVENSINTIGINETQRIINQAILFLDETAIVTIHSFCQRTLSEYAFETNQIFGSGAMSPSDIMELTIDQVNDFWRKQVVILKLELLHYLVPKFLSRELLLQYIQEAAGGKKLVALLPFEPEILSINQQNQVLLLLNEQQEIIRNAYALGTVFFNEHKDELYNAVEANQYAQKKLLHLFDDPALVIDAILENSSTGYIQLIFADLIVLLEGITPAQSMLDQLLYQYSNQLYQLAIDKILNKVNLRKESNSLLGFDDMIRKLHQTVVLQNNQTLLAALQLKYKAVFIDEFQDTDKFQYEIFNTIFGTNTILFYIGDPKQSIYAWRQADINTYFKASNTVTNKYGMNTNYRSSKQVIEAQNVFFKPTADFDTFYFGAASNAILYTNVAAPLTNENMLLLNGKPTTPINIYENKNNDAIMEDVVANVIELLTNPAYTIIEDGIQKAINPSDIGILVRKNEKGLDIKKKLAYYKIPSVTIDETKLSDTLEATELLYVLQAVADIRASNINRALLSGLTGFFIEQVSQLNEELVLQQFKTYQQAWTKEGVYVMLMKFITDYRVKSHLLESNSSGGERILSNVLQLVELLHKIQINKQYSPSELINWLQKLIEGHTAEGDEFEQRIESDEDAVKIVTIHKSKGLEYNIVIAPFLDSKPDIKDFANFRDDQSGEYLFANKPILTTEQNTTILTQLEQENRRLIYVAITRAKYKCFLHHNLTSYYKNSSFKPFIQAVKDTHPAGINFELAPQIPQRFRYNEGKISFPINYKKAANFSLEQLYWHKLSYTFLNPEHLPQQKSTTNNPKDAYSEFVFSTLKKGAFTGNLLHYIFEYIHFSDNIHWDNVITKALKRLAPGFRDIYATPLVELLQQVTATTLQCNGQSFSLSQINHEHRLNEFEFDFIVQPFQVPQINQLSTAKVPLHLKTFQRSSGQLEGIMNGKMDLFFEHGGKYYILDWKSNYLGDTIADYTNDKVWDAMAENNYHLQYHIYTVAVCKYLSLHVPGFSYETHFGGVIYLFVRGVRKGETTGIFFHQPEKNTIDQLTKYLSYPALANLDA